jgi:uncharacterized protein YajQ (UPF0234 family)
MTRLIVSVDAKTWLVRQAVVYDELGEHRDGPLRGHRGELRGWRTRCSSRAPAGRRGRRALTEEGTMAKGDNSFDVACKVDPQAVADAVHQATRDVQQRYDLKQTKTTLTEKDAITVHTDNDYVLKQVLDVLQSKLHRRGVPLKALVYGKVEPAAGGTVRQRIDVQQGIPMEKGKEIVRLIKDTKLKVQAQIQEDQVRVFGKNRDDLQAVIKLLRDKDLGIEMQFTNFRTE